MEKMIKILKIFLIFISAILILPVCSYAAKGAAKQVEEKIGLDEDMTSQDRIDEIGQRIAAVCDKKDIVYTFKVLKGEDINAFALPDGYVYIYKGLVDKAKTDDEIAAVLAHEIGHIVSKHHQERSRRYLLANIFQIVAVTGAETKQDKVNIYNAINELTLSYSREEEIEADRTATIYLKRAKYDPMAVISMIKILIKSELEGPIKPQRKWRTHPYLNDRIKVAREEIEGRIDFVDYINTPTHGVERYYGK
ncbi:MAG: M48 family metalloprotease [Candidatus Omnitrophota bacterium]